MVVGGNVVVVVSSLKAAFARSGVGGEGAVVVVDSDAATGAAGSRGIAGGCSGGGSRPIGCGAIGCGSGVTGCGPGAIGWGDGCGAGEGSGTG